MYSNRSSSCDKCLKRFYVKRPRHQLHRAYEIKFMNSGKDIAKYTRTPGTGEVVYNEVGGKIVGSYLIVDFYGSAGYGLTEYGGG